MPLNLALTERMKELTCLQRIEQIIGAHQGTIDDILRETVEVMPEAWLHSANAIARISRGSKVYQTGNLDHCKSVLSSDIKANNNLYGSIQVGYTEHFEKAVEGPFMAEERLYKQLLSLVARMVEMRDPYTAGHQKRVANLCVAIGKELGLSPHQLEGVQLAGSVHDIGKIMVPTEILCKPSKLTRIEYELIKQHSQAGYDILKNVAFPWPIARIVLEHHERMDGSGYPNEISGQNLLLESRIVTVADVVESMSAHRPYRPALGTVVALAEITRNRGTLYDCEVVDACLRLFHQKGFEFGDKTQP